MTVLAAALSAAMRGAPTKLAVLDTDSDKWVHHPWQEVHARSENVADRIVDDGSTAVGLVGEPTVEFIAAIPGTFFAGAARVDPARTHPACRSPAVGTDHSGQVPHHRGDDGLQPRRRIGTVARRTPRESSSTISSKSPTHTVRPPSKGPRPPTSRSCRAPRDRRERHAQHRFRPRPHWPTSAG